MKRIGLGALCALSLGTSSMAADLDVRPVYRPVAVVAPFTWTGIYLGINGGYGSAKGNATYNYVTPLIIGTTVVNGGDKIAGPLVGAQLGFNYQAGPVVFGAEVDGQWSSQSHTTLDLCGIGCTTNEEVKVQGFATARARIGAAMDRILVYATGGAALSWFSDKGTVTVGGVNFNVFDFSASKAGWVAGAGIEGAFYGNWSLRGEYLYISTTGITSNSTILGFGTANVTADVTNNIFRGAINYRFGP